jgi:hypothetical protein
MCGGWCIRWGSVRRRSQGLDPLCHFSDGGGVRGPTQRSISQGGDPAGLELGAGWVEVALARCQMMGRPYLDDTHRPRSGSLKARPIRSVPSRVLVGEGRVAEGSGVGGGGRSDYAAKWNRGRGKWTRVRVVRSEREETT